MSNAKEIESRLEVLRVLARTATSIRRGEKLELVDAGADFERQFKNEIDELTKSITPTLGLPLDNHQAA